VEVEAEHRERELERREQVRREARAERRAVHDERLERLALFLELARPDPDLAPVERDRLPAVAIFFRVFVCGGVSGRGQDKMGGRAPYTESSVFAAAACSSGGMTTGRYGSNSAPIAWHTFAHVAMR
jgi:hypothetical protein